jgi:glycerol uptake facilitator-like aquaporin
MSRLSHPPVAWYSLILSINWSSGASAPFAISITLFAALVVFGSVTGGHFNPAVTIAVLIKNGQFKKDLGFAAMIIMS